MERSYYSELIDGFLAAEPRAILGDLSRNSDGPVVQTQIDAWSHQIEILQSILTSKEGKIYFEYSIPRMGKRIDVVLVIQSVVFVLEFKVGAKCFDSYATDQACDYALDLKNFHSTSRDCVVAPILIASKAKASGYTIATTPQNDNLLFSIQTGSSQLEDVIKDVIAFSTHERLDPDAWEKGSYCPTPTIIEAALALYRGHSVKEISRSDAGAINLDETTDAISSIIESARNEQNKAICFVTGVPGAGKTLIGLNVATKHINPKKETASVFLSGNGPLVKVLQEALARDLVEREIESGNRISKKEAHSRVKAFVQAVHHYRDAYIVDKSPPYDHVALFDEALRAWNKEKTTDFMTRKKNQPNFNMSEPEFLISCIDRHKDWGVVVCLVGGGQEIHTGEAGIGEWIDAVNSRFPDWQINISSKLTDSEYEAGDVLKRISSRNHVSYRDDLHLSVSMRSFRAENVSLLVKQLLDIVSFPVIRTV